MLIKIRVINNPKDIYNVLNTYFTNARKNVAESIELNKNENPVSHYLRPSYANALYLDAIDECEVENVLKV